MEEPFPDCPKYKQLLRKIDSLKNSMRTLEENIERKQLSLELFISNRLMT